VLNAILSNNIRSYLSNITSKILGYSNGSGLPGCGPGCYPENRGNWRVRGRVGTGPRFHITVPTTLAPIKYLNSDCIATWSLFEMCRLMPYFVSHSQICDWTSIHWVALKLSRNTRQNDRVSIATPRELVRLQIGEREMREGIKLHISRIDYVTIQWELQYLIEARNVDFCGVSFVWKPVATVWFRVRPWPGTKPGLWTLCKH
jgi:hypothetical protein